METPIKMDDLGVPLFLETPISSHPKIYWWKSYLIMMTPSFFLLGEEIIFETSTQKLVGQAVFELEKNGYSTGCPRKLVLLEIRINGK